jgi:hypothetical protein
MAPAAGGRSPRYIRPDAIILHTRPPAYWSKGFAEESTEGDGIGRMTHIAYEQSTPRAFVDA